MRMAGAVTSGVLIIEALLAGAFVLGFYWLDGWQWGMLFSAVLLLLIVLPWLGELKLVFDSEGPKGAVKIGWWGRVSFAQGKKAGRLVIRVLGIPIRRTVGEKKEAAKAAPTGEPPPEFEPAAEAGLAEERTPEPTEEKAPAKKEPSWWQKVDSETVEAFCRIIGSSLGATCELVWGADEIRVSVQDPAEQAVADAIIEQVFGRRQIGPADVMITTGDCHRRVRALYRIGLLRAALAGVQVVIDGRAREFAKLMKSKSKQKPVVDEDQRIIEQIVEQSALCEEDED